jgi:uracil-DNA glycosylase family 4
VKPAPLNRGGLAPVMIVGEGPGRSEVKKQRAFAGQSGKRLDAWLVSCGAAASAPRRSVYLTSVIKCVCPQRGPYGDMANRCAPFLDAQIRLQKPALIITLGTRAYRALRFTHDQYHAAIGKPYRSSDYLIVTKFDHHVTLLPWPHPSGLNRLLNDSETLERVRASFPIVRRFFTDAA